MNDNLPTPNIPLLRKAVEWAEAEAAKTDGLWNQGDYKLETPCGTAYCVAGYVVSSQPGYQGGDDMATLNGVEDWWDDHAARLLGITSWESDELFAATNSIDIVRAIAEEIADRAGERL